VLLVCRVEIPIVIDMPLLSTFLQFRVCDNSRRRYDLDDIAIALLESDYPTVTHFVYRNSERQHMMVPWHAVTGIDWPHSRIHVKNFDAAQPATDGSLRQEVLLKRDVLDALVLDFV
jgi:hypothetical protein